MTMKKSLFSMAMAFIMISFPMMAQTTLTEGHIKMEITEATSDDEQMAMGLEMMKGTETHIIFNETTYVSKMNMMGGMIDIKTYVTESSDEFNMLMDAMGQKMWVASSIKDAESSDSQNLAKNAKVTYDESNTKEISGYNCYQMKITTPDAPDMEVTGYVTKDIKTNANIIQGMQSLDLDGFPLEFTIKNTMMTITMSATDIQNTVDKSEFEMKTDGFKKMTMAEFEQAMGQMGGGMGF